MRNQYFLFFLLISIALTNNSSAQYVWKQRTAIGGIGRIGPYGFSILNKGYIGGGGDINYNNVRDFWEFDPATNLWTQKSDAPGFVRAVGSFVINGKGYITGGIQNVAGFNAQLWMYDPAINTWTTKASYPGVPIYGAVGFAIGTNGYFGIGNGGTRNGPCYTDFYQYDAITDSWSQKNNFPGPARYGTYGISLNGKAYVGFGVDDANNIYYNDWWQYDPLSDSWTAEANLPVGSREYISGFCIIGKIYVGVGGYQGTALNDFYEYDTNLNSWGKKANYGGGYRWADAGFAIGDTGYFGAGNDFTNNYNDFWEYIPVSLPSASFQSNDSTICANNCINFTDHSLNATSWLWSFPGATPSSSTDQNPLGVCYFVTGKYDVTLIASNSTGSDTLKLKNYITVNIAPLAPVITQVGDTLFCTTDPTYSSYQWYYYNSPIPGATDTFLLVSFNGNYNVKVTNENGCSVAVGINVIIGLHEVESNPYFTLYPNPVSSELTISMLKNLHNADMEIKDVLGRVLFQRVFDSAENKNQAIDFSDFTTGVYFITVGFAETKTTRRVIKE